MDSTDARRARTVAQFVPAIGAAYGERPAVKRDDRTLSYQRLDTESARMARGLLASGVGKGSRIGILFGNGPEWVLWWAAISRIGAVCVPLSTFLQPAEIGKVARHADLHAIVTADTFLDRALLGALEAAFPTVASAQTPQLCLPEAPFLRWIAVDGAADKPWATTVDALLDAGAEQLWADVLAAAQREVDPDEEAFIVYTSGQSADPKGVVHTQGALMTKAQYLREAYGFVDGVACDIKLPFFWVGGLMMGLLPALVAGGVTICSEKSTWGSGQVIGSSTAQANPFAHFPMQASLGMTETLGIYGWGHEWRAAGYPLSAPIDVLQDGFELKLVDDDGAPVSDGKPGQILLRGPTVTTRLHKVSRDGHYDADGFYRTGDQAVRHGNRVHFVGRMGDMIKTSGANVAPAEVERELSDMPEVRCAYVVALDDAEREQIVAAAVVLNAGAAVAPTEMKRRLAERLSRYKVPKKIVVFESIDDIPMTPSLKVRRKELAALIAARDETSS